MVFIIFGLICGEIYAAGNKNANACTNAQRVSFVKSLGYELLSDTAETKEVNIPTIFSDVYKNYNQLQKKANFDLSQYKGCDVVIYTYNIKAPKDYSGECVFNMIVYKGRVIGGDISSRQLDGYMLPIVKVKN